MVDELALFLVIVSLYGFTKLSVIESLFISFKLAFEIVFATTTALDIGMIIAAIFTIINLMSVITVRFVVILHLLVRAWFATTFCCSWSLSLIIDSLVPFLFDWLIKVLFVVSLISLVSGVPHISVVVTTTFAEATMMFKLFPMLVLALVSIINTLMTVVVPDFILATPMELASTTLLSTVITILIISFVFTMIVMIILLLVLVMRLLESLLILLHVPAFRLLLIFCSSVIHLATSFAATEPLFLFVRRPLPTFEMLMPLLTFSQIYLLNGPNRD